MEIIELEADLSKHRNRNLDTLRSVAMMWVIFIHCLYHTSIFQSGISSAVKSLFLLEMPLFFFIAGASNCLSRKRTLLQFYVSRIQRLLIPYWIYAVIVIIFCFMVGFIYSNAVNGWYIRWNFPLIFKPETTLPYLTWSLWFVPVYLLVILIFPFLAGYYKKFADTLFQYIPLFILAGFSLTLLLYKPLYINHMITYSFWTYAGLFFNQLDQPKPLRKKCFPVLLITGISAVLTAAAVALPFFHAYANMQSNKFPPNFAFLSYSAGALSFLYLFYEPVLRMIDFIRHCKWIDRIFQSYSQNCLTIFLYHPFAFLAMSVMTKWTGTEVFLQRHPFLLLFIYVVIMIPLNAVLGRAMNWSEKIKWGK
jgi:fucose 4-O-acetylase-like acetyltransferase